MAQLSRTCELPHRPGELWPAMLAYDRNVAALAVVESVHLTRTGEHDRIADWVVRLRGSSLRWSQYERLDPHNHTVAFELRHGELSRLCGQWRLGSAGSGTVASVTVDFDFGLPRIAVVFNTLLTESLTQVIEGLCRNARAQLSVGADQT